MPSAGALIVLLLLIFYSSQIFVLGAEFTRAWTHVSGSRCDDPALMPRGKPRQAGLTGNTRGGRSLGTGRA